MSSRRESKEKNALAFENLNGRQKAAILLLAVGKSAASSVMKQMSPREVETVMHEIAELGNVPNATIEQVLAEFYENTLGKRRVHAGGMDYARAVLTQSFGAQTGEEIMGKVTESIQSRSFRVLKQLDASQLISFLRDEHPQTIALVLVHLHPKQAAVVLAGIPEEMQGDVARRMARIGPTAPGAIKKIEDQLEKHVSAIHLSSEATGGPQAVVDVLHQVDRATEEGILESIAEDDPDLAEEIRNLMFIFEDIVKLDDRAIRELLKEVETKELGLAMKGASDEIKDKIFNNMSKRAKEGILEDMEFMGPVRLADVEGAQKAILTILRRLEEEGTVVLSGGEDSYVS